MTFLELLRQRGVVFRRSLADPDEVWLCCLFCTQMGETPDTRFRLGINVATGLGHCFNCGWSSRNAVERVLRKLSLTPEILEPEPRPKKHYRPRLPAGFQLFTKEALKDDLIARAYRYLLDRGLTPEQIRDKKIGVCLSGRFSYRVVFPVYFRGKLVQLVARDFTGRRHVRYLNLPGPRFLYNLPDRADSVVLSEGVIKCLTIERATGVVSAAVLGHDLTPVQVDQLKACGCHSVCIWPDDDPPGRIGAVNMATKLVEEGFRVFLVWPPPGEADELDDDSVRKAVKERVCKYTWRLGCLGRML